MNVQNVVILIPPSEGKRCSGSGAPLKKVSSDVHAMITAVQTFSGDWQKLLGVKGKALELAIKANQMLLRSPTMPSIERYCGVVYDALEYHSLSTTAKQFCNAHVRIISAVFGCIAPMDLIPDYKLKIDKLNASDYWRPIISEQLKKSFVIDCLPQAHQKAVRYKNGLNIDFKIESNGVCKPAGHAGKLIKGKFIRWLCESAITDPSMVKNFKEDGFRWNGEFFIKS